MISATLWRLTLAVAISVLTIRPTHAVPLERPAESRQVIRDRYSRTLGEIRTASTGRLEARDRYGRLLGTYDPKRDETRDCSGRLLAKGNILSALIVKAAEQRNQSR
jgi:hypothetical protein